MRLGLLILVGCNSAFGIETVGPPADATPPDGPIGYAAAVLADHPLAYLPLDELSGIVAHDRAGSNDGTYLGTGLTLGADPPFASAGHAISIDGRDGAVDLGDRFGFPGTLPYTIEVWVAPQVIANRTYYSIISKWREPGTLPPSGWNVFYDNTSNVAYTRETPGSPIAQPRASALYTPGWHYIVATYDGAAMLLYYDAKEADMVATAMGLVPVTQHLEIGGANGDPRAVPLLGSIAQVAIYDHVLPFDRILAHYTARAE